MRTRRKPEPGVVVLDFRPIVDAFRAIADAVVRAGRTLREGFDPTLRARLAAGGAGDPRSDDWQSGPCSGWLHDACPNPAATDCRCTCHGGHLR